jgi:hypothetical protein
VNNNILFNRKSDQLVVFLMSFYRYKDLIRNNLQGIDLVIGQDNSGKAMLFRFTIEKANIADLADEM